MNLLSIVVLALIGEAVWETLKMTWQNGKVSIDRIGALLVGLLLAIGTGMDLLEAAGIKMMIPFVGTVLTGILISRGANFTHDIVATVNNLQSTTRATRNISTQVSETTDEKK